jgi:hypothetical protein
MIDLNNKPLSELIRIAVRDCQVCEADPNYKLNMGVWKVTKDDVCEVCMAGAVLAKTLCFEDDVRSLGLRLEPVAAALSAIDSVRIGDIWAALAWDLKIIPEDYDTSDLSEAQCEAVDAACVLIEKGYLKDDDDYRRADWATYLEAADILEGAGL